MALTSDHWVETKPEQIGDEVLSDKMGPFHFNRPEPVSFVTAFYPNELVIALFCKPYLTNLIHYRLHSNPSQFLAICSFDVCLRFHKACCSKINGKGLFSRILHHHPKSVSYDFIFLHLKPEISGSVSLFRRWRESPTSNDDRIGFVVAELLLTIGGWLRSSWGTDCQLRINSCQSFLRGFEDVPLYVGIIIIYKCKTCSFRVGGSAIAQLSIEVEWRLYIFFERRKPLCIKRDYRSLYLQKMFMIKW